MVIKRGDERLYVVPGHDWFWKIFEDGSWEPETFKIFDRFLTPESVMLDIGAWIGPTSMYAASRARQVFAFEPDPVAYKSLVQNLDFNAMDNVIPYPVAVSNKWGGIPFGAKTGFGDSMSSEIWAKDDSKVPAVALRSLLVELRPDFIKVDIEGGEEKLFKFSHAALAEVKPTIHLSLHTPSFLDDLEGFRNSVMANLDMYPFFYDENLNQIELANAFNPNAFNSIVASFKQI